MRRYSASFIEVTSKVFDNLICGILDEWELHGAVRANLTDHGKRRFPPGQKNPQLSLHKIFDTFPMTGFQRQELICITHVGPEDHKVIHSTPGGIVEFMQPALK